jgi:predicted Zn-dependent peptidase
MMNSQSSSRHCKLFSRLWVIWFVWFIFLLISPSCLFSEGLGERVERVTLKNGLRLLMLERHLSPTVSIYIRYRAGAVDEADGKTGTAHLLEHMMFKGTKTIGTRDYRKEEKIIDQIKKIGTTLDHQKTKGSLADPEILTNLNDRLKKLETEQRRLTISNEIDRLYTENGAVGLNASTGQDLTTYQVSIPANRIELWARIESDRMVNPVFREFFTERDVVMEERRQRIESDSDGKLYETYLATAFLAHPYRRPILGWPSDMTCLDMDYMRIFYKKSLAPNNTVIAVVGDIRPAEVLKIVEKYFGAIPPQNFSPSLVTEEPRQLGERRVEVRFDAQPQMIIGYHKPPPPGFDDYVFDVIESILARGRTSRLFKTLIDEKRIAENINAANGLPGSRYPNQFALFATPRHPNDCGELEQAIDQEIDKLKRDPVPPAELEKVKNQIRADFIRGLNSNSGLAGMLSYYEALVGDYHYMVNYTATIDRITPEDILKAAQTYLTKENRTIVTLVNSH